MASTWTPDRILALRESLGLTQGEFAEALGMSRTASVTDLEKGRTSATGPTARILDAIAAHGPDVGRTRGGTLADDLDELARAAASLARRARGEGGL